MFALYFNQVNMKEGFSLPEVTLNWKKFHSQIATSWMLEFEVRLQHWQLLTYVVTYNVSLA